MDAFDSVLDRLTTKDEHASNELDNEDAGSSTTESMSLAELDLSNLNFLNILWRGGCDMTCLNRLVDEVRIEKRFLQ